MSRSRLSLLAPLLVFGALAACDKVALTAPTGSTVTLSINTSVVPINGTASVIASVTESAGTPPQDGTVVTFTASFGTISPQDARTVGGKATVTFTGTQSGKAKIGAFSGSAKATELEVLVGGAAAGAVAVRTEPSTVPQDGGTVQVYALVTDASGNPLPTAPVSFTTDNGTLSSGSAITDANGVAQTSLTTSRETKVTATVFGTVLGTATVKVLGAPTVTITTTGAAAAVGIGVSFTVTPGPTAGGSPIQNVSVDFGDGTSPVNLGAVTGATGVAHTFTRAGSYTVTATITDTVGQRGTSSVAVIVQRILPNVAITATPTTIKAGETSAFTVTASPGTGGPPLNSVQVTLDGTVVYNGTGGGSFTRQFPSPGSYTAVATATDVAGTTATASVTVVATAGTGPTAVLTFSPSAPTTSTSVFFDGSGSTAGASPIASYRFTWGDNTPDTAGGSSTATHTFANAGTYTVRLTVTDSAGGTGTTTKDVTVISTSVGPTAAFTFLPLSPKAGVDLVTFNATTSTAGSSPITTYVFKWGDSTADTTVGTAGIATHTFAAAGTYSVQLIAIDSALRTGTTTHSVIVVP